MQALQRMLAAGAPDAQALDALVADLERERRVEQAWLLLRLSRPDPAAWSTCLARIKAIVERGRAQRMHQAQTDPDRVILRLRFELRTPACVHNPAALLSLLSAALLGAGLPVALGPEKSLRPDIHLGHPLPPMVEGRCEWADAALQEGVGAPAAELPQRINPHAPPGLRILECVQVPGHASPVAELCRRAHWRWACPASRLEEARRALDTFLASERFEMEKAGKVAGQKGAKRVDIRPLLERCRWAEGGLAFETAIAPGEAANPRKMLGAILGGEVPAGELVRERVDLGEDPRLLQPDKYQPKLHNMYEDAVLLESGGSLRIVEDDDDEPVVLG
jgi:radical SAM-linked protein